jgi:transcriptional regulator with XRE-family HTH domain
MADQDPYARRNQDLGEMLRKARESSGKSIRETAKAMGISSGALSAYESGEKGISLPELELFCYFINVPVRRFFFRSDADFYPEHVGFDPDVMLTLRNRTIGAMLRAQRLEAGMSVRELSERTGWPSSRISSFERGRRNIPLPVLETLSGLFGQPIEEFLATGGPIAKWDAFYRSLDTVMELPQDVREFLSDPENTRYLRLAMNLRDFPLEDMRMVAEGLLDLTL